MREFLLAVAVLGLVATDFYEGWTVDEGVTLAVALIVGVLIFFDD
ncbi:hypothetical protein [Roseibium aggregatum]|uniref:Uncharacterized protein n=1 Tax=Roseibium aggregatum TaxID=187304 RepID=A0A0M6YA56_9HYPH|nr:hypothetical protein [Roseibium aggregatum]CTQ45690.1 hypothetical protein LAL4801_04145 [Roseibium aggregatum]